MQILIKTTNIELTPAMRSFVEEKIGSVAKFINSKEAESAEARVEIGKPSLHHKSGLVFRAEVNLRIGGQLLRAEEEHADLYSAVDLIRDELERQIKKHKDKKLSSRRSSIEK